MFGVTRASREYVLYPLPDGRTEKPLFFIEANPGRGEPAALGLLRYDDFSDAA